ncbi:hypothetical protein CTRI78_v004100 [Colletotrichum trifolii]|uniref:Uncharacterized protein n=1 Tax=Colletotrichum trifolii TaxID=5466 RepID=A0A4V6QEZ0_COLTR|nr:hypothetical protein CTRI78_v004100 [Colletotrichum trifolii]
MKFISTIVLLASTGAVLAGTIDSTRANPRVVRADGTFNAKPKPSIGGGTGGEITKKDKIDGTLPVKEERDAQEPTKANPRGVRADGTFNLVPRQTERAPEPGP